MSEPPRANEYYDEYLVETRLCSWGGLSQSESDSLMSNAKRMGMSTAKAMLPPKEEEAGKGRVG